MTPELTVYARLKNLHDQLMILIPEIGDEVVDATRITPGRAADIAYAMKLSTELAQTIKQRCNKIREKAEWMGCLVYVHAGGEGQIVGNYAKGTAKVDQVVDLPTHKENPERYAEFCRALGIPENIIEDRTFTPHWAHLQDLISCRLMKGEKVPPQIDVTKTKPKYRMLTRLQTKFGALNDVLEDDDNDEENGDSES